MLLMLRMPIGLSAYDERFRAWGGALGGCGDRDMGVGADGGGRSRSTLCTFARVESMRRPY